jgi:hypothetical protein
MHRTSLLLALALIPSGSAQVLSPPEILDPELKALQQKHMAELKTVATAITSHQFPYHFYLSRKLDISEDQEQTADRRSIQFSRFRNQIVLQITGNYFAAYPGETMNKQERARKTVNDVMVPILKAAATNLLSEPGFQGFALEISHHVRGKMLGVGGERSENVVLSLSREDAGRLLTAVNEGQLRAALEPASILVDGRETPLWRREEPAVVAASNRVMPIAAKVDVTNSIVTKPDSAPPAPVQINSTPPPPQPEKLRSLQSNYQTVLDRMVRDLDSTARFVGYAPPTFISFHNGTYLQLSITTPVPTSATTSRYRLGALAFDDHVARLIRPIMAYFKDDPEFDGINFSTSIKPPEGGSSVAIEYIFKIASLRCYEQYDCTGQQIINSGFVLINGERVGLDLQSAETNSAK